VIYKDIHKHKQVCQQQKFNVIVKKIIVKSLIGFNRSATCRRLSRCGTQGKQNSNVKLQSLIHRNYIMMFTEIT